MSPLTGRASSESSAVVAGRLLKFSVQLTVEVIL